MIKTVEKRSWIKDEEGGCFSAFHPIFDPTVSLVPVYITMCITYPKGRHERIYSYSNGGLSHEKGALYLK